MAETIPDFKVTSEAWVDISTKGIPVGTKYDIENRRGTWVILHESASEPLLTETSGRSLATFPNDNSHATIPAGSLNIWAKAIPNGAYTVATLNIQVV